MKTSEMREKSLDALQTELVTLKKEQFNLRFQAANMELENTARVRTVRRSIARIKSVMGEKKKAEGAA